LNDVDKDPRRAAQRYEGLSNTPTKEDPGKPSTFSFVIVFLHAAWMYVSEDEDETEDGYYTRHPPNPSGRNQQKGCRKLAASLSCYINIAA
jgi:hypothetical protein